MTFMISVVGGKNSLFISSKTLCGGFVTLLESSSSNTLRLGCDLETQLRPLGVDFTSEVKMTLKLARSKNTHYI